MKKEKLRKWLVSYKKDGEIGVGLDALSAFTAPSKSGSTEFEGNGYLTIEGLEPSTSYCISIGQEIETEGSETYSKSGIEENKTSTEKGEIRISFSGLYHTIE